MPPFLGSRRGVVAVWEGDLYRYEPNQEVPSPHAGASGLDPACRRRYVLHFCSIFIRTVSWQSLLRTTASWTAVPTGEYTPPMSEERRSASSFLLLLRKPTFNIRPRQLNPHVIIRNPRPHFRSPRSGLRVRSGDVHCVLPAWCELWT